jgi:DNA polymerase-3 subunit beta
MKFKCSQSDLSHKLSTVGLAIAKTHHSHPVLTNVAIKAEEDKIILIGSNLSFSIRVELDGAIEETGSVTVPHSFLLSMIQKLPDGEIVIACEDETEDNPSIDIHSLSGKYKLRGMEYDQYPEIMRDIKAEIEIELDVESFKKGLAFVLPSCAKDETKQVLTGVNFKITEDNQLTLASTDGHRLSCITLDDTVSVETIVDTTQEIKEEPFDELENNNFDLPDEEEEENETTKTNEIRVTIKGEELAKLLTILNTQHDDKITLKYDDSNLCFKLKDTLVISRVLNGNFPKYEQLVPKEFLGYLVCDKELFSKAMDRAAVILDGKNNLIKLEMDQDETTLTFKATARDLGDAKQIIRC